MNDRSSSRRGFLSVVARIVRVVFVLVDATDGRSKNASA